MALRTAGISLLSLYGGWYYMTSECQRRPVAFGPGWLADGIQRVLRALFRASGVDSKVVLDDEFSTALDAATVKPCVITVSPHGAFALGHLCLNIGRFRDDARFTGLDGYVGGATVLFRIPLVRDLLLVLGVREAAQSTLDAAVATGHSIGLNTGGLWEQIHVDCEREQLFLLPRLGFIRLALRHGVPLVPTYAFGENQLYRTHDVFLAARRWIVKHWRTGLPVVSGKWWCPILPRSGKHIYCVGRPVPTSTEPCPDPTDEQVNEIRVLWEAEMQRLFNEHKYAYLPRQIADRGLTIAMSNHRE